MRGLRALVADNDATALERLEPLLGRAPGRLRERMQRIHKALGGYDFEQALSLIDALLDEEGKHA
jgi:hypothetical protein